MADAIRMIQFDLPYHAGASWLQWLRHWEWPMLLESGQQSPLRADVPIDEEATLGARFDIVVAAPQCKWVTSGSNTHVWQADSDTWLVSTEDPFALLKAQLSAYTATRQADIPFAGGVLGYWSYDLGRRIEPLAAVAADDLPLPEMQVGLYTWAIVVDHLSQRCQLVSHGCGISDQALRALHSQLNQLAQTPAGQTAAAASECSDASLSARHGQEFAVQGALQSNLSPARYAEVFARVKDYIAAGDCYQINLAQRFSVAVTGDSWQAYQTFKQLSRAPFMAYLQLTDAQGQAFAVLSMSPERFLQVRDGMVETRPIKGTRRRHTDADADAAEAADLAASVKDRAENLMIVDLLRNDIGKVCQIGSVKVTALFKLQRFTNVHHMVSIIRGRLAKGFHAVDLLRACFPGGSITGAPKLRAMQIIEALEPHRRGIYCGSIGYIGFDGGMDTNIAIRTSVIRQGRMNFFAGGGIVADSDCAQEYQETLDKASQFFKLVAHYTSTQSPNAGESTCNG